MALDTTAIANDMFDKLMSLTKGKTMDAALLTSLAVSAVVLIENSKITQGDQKKAIVLAVLGKLIDMAQLDEMTRMNLKFLLSHSIPKMIDLVIDVKNGEIVIGAPSAPGSGQENGASWCCFYKPSAKPSV